jgi:LPXTG-site transpeptidase (sortase) family protein
MSLQIPAIYLNAPVVTTGLESGGQLHVPGNPFQVGWYKYSPTPGDIGPAVLTGHMDFGAKFRPTVFYNLHKLQPGDEIDVTRSDGSIAAFSVTDMAYYDQNNFPTQLVYGGVKDAELRLITCAGTYDKSEGHYTQDLVVFAKLK